jgi:hypothetical protein
VQLILPRTHGVILGEVDDAQESPHNAIGGGKLANLCRANSQGHHQVAICHSRGSPRYVLIAEGRGSRSSDGDAQANSPRT